MDGALVVVADISIHTVVFLGTAAVKVYDPINDQTIGTLHAVSYKEITSPLSIPLFPESNTRVTLKVWFGPAKYVSILEAP
jgi:hypothetical protein